MFSKMNYRLLFTLMSCLGALALGACATNTGAMTMNCPCCENMKAGEECCCKDMKDCPCCKDMHTDRGMTCMPKN
jgi:hypothetical protein